MAIEPMAVETPTRSRRILMFVVLAGGLAIGLSVWLLLGLTSGLSGGSYRSADPEAHWVPAELGDESGGRSVVTDPGDGTNDAVWSFRNAGRLPITVSVADPQPAAPMARVAGVFAFDTVEPFRNAGSSADAVRLAPGQEVGVRVSVGFGCAPWEAGAAAPGSMRWTCA